MSYRTHTNRARAQRESIDAWARLLSAVGLLVAAFIAVAYFLPSTAEGSAPHPENHESYWEVVVSGRNHGYPTTCVKHEQALQGPRWQADQDFDLVVLKAGTRHHEFWGVAADTWLSTPTGKDISHVIECVVTIPPIVPTTTTEPPVVTTTSVPPTTTAPPAPTTTVEPPATTVRPPATTTAPPTPTTTVTPPICVTEWGGVEVTVATAEYDECGNPTITVTSSTPAVPVPVEPQFTG